MTKGRQGLLLMNVANGRAGGGWWGVGPGGGRVSQHERSRKVRPSCSGLFLVLLSPATFCVNTRAEKLVSVYVSNASFHPYVFAFSLCIRFSGWVLYTAHTFAIPATRVVRRISSTRLSVRSISVATNRHPSTASRHAYIIHNIAFSPR